MQHIPDQIKAIQFYEDFLYPLISRAGADGLMDTKGHFFLLWHM